MSTIKSYARFLEIFCLSLVIPVLTTSFIYKWFGGKMPVYSDIADCSRKVTIYTGLSYVYNTPPSQQAIFTFISRLLGAFIDGISWALLLWGCLCFIKVLRFYQRSEIFSANTLALFNKMSRIAFAWTVYEPLKFTLLSIVTTLSNQEGQRVIALGFTSNDVVHIFMVGFFLIITSLMQEAYTIKNENDLTV
jgi:hypothetical protein